MLEIESPGEAEGAERGTTPAWLVGRFGIPLLGQVLLATVLYAVLTWWLRRACDDYALYARWIGALPSAFEVAEAWIAAYGMTVCFRRRDRGDRTLRFISLGCGVLLAGQFMALGSRVLSVFWTGTPKSLWNFCLFVNGASSVAVLAGRAYLIAAVRRALPLGGGVGSAWAGNVDRRPRPARFQFGINALLLAMVVAAVYGSLVRLKPEIPGVSFLWGYWMALGPALLFGVTGWGLSLALRNLRHTPAGAGRRMLVCTAAYCLPMLLWLPLWIGLTQFPSLVPLLFSVYSGDVYAWVYRGVSLLTVVLFALWLGAIYQCVVEGSEC